MSMKTLGVSVRASSVTCTVGSTSFSFSVSWNSLFSDSQSLNFLKYISDDSGNIVSRASVSQKDDSLSFSVEQTNDTSTNEKGKLIVYIVKDGTTYKMTGTASYSSDSISATRTGTISEELDSTDMDSLDISADISRFVDSQTRVFTLS